MFSRFVATLQMSVLKIVPNVQKVLFKCNSRACKGFTVLDTGASLNNILIWYWLVLCVLTFSDDL